jgi:alpha-D-xyloside xylohydrolase
MSSFSFRKLVIVLAIGFIARPALPLGSAAFERSEKGVTFRTSNRTMLVSVCSDKVIHVVVSPTKDIPESNVPTVIRPCSGTPFKLSSTSSKVSLKTSSVIVEIDRDSLAVEFKNSAGERISAEQAKDGRVITPIAIGTASSFEVKQDFLLSPDEALYGLGQHQEGFLNARNIPLQLLQANTNIAIPFVVSTKGYGLLWNNAALTEFNPTTKSIALDANGKGTFQTDAAGEYGFLLSGNERRRLHLSLNGEKIIDITNMWVADSAGAKIHLDGNTTYNLSAETGGNTQLRVRVPSDTMGFRSDASRAIDYYFIYGPQPDQVVSQYRDMTGAAPLLPLWAYGFWQCRERYSSQQQVLDTAAEFRKRKIPVDVMVQDWQYWGKYGWNAMKFDERYYPKPAELMSALHRDNFHMVISVWAKFGVQTEVNQEFVNAGLILKSAAATGEPGESKETEDWVDLFNPKAQSLYWTDLDRGLFRDGLDGWWLDASEPEGDPLKSDNTFLGPGRTVRNAFPLFETTAVYKGQRAADENKRVVILTRSAFTGQQRNGIINWSGDISGNWDTLKRQIPAGLNFGMSGFPYWTTDVGGFFRPRDQYTSATYQELLIRWFQFGAFSPIFRVHGYQSETEMWKYGPQVESILRKYDELRYRLMPYVYSTAWGVTNRGETMMKALPFVYPSDQSLREVSDQFLFGDSLLINPVTDPSVTTRKVVLPAGSEWYDFWSGQKSKGGQTIVADAPLDRLPILVKAGSIMPLGPKIQYASENQDPTELRIYAGKDADFQLYEDSGDGYAYERGERATINLHWNDKSRELTIGERSGSFPGMRDKRTFNVVLARSYHGVGLEPAEEYDRSVAYTGRRISVRLNQVNSLRP